MIRESVPGEGLFIPRAGRVLSLQEPSHPAQHMLVEAILTREDSDYCPRRLRGGADTSSAPARIPIAEATLAPSAVFILLRFQPAHRAPDPGLAEVDANRA